jgi:hypothetical protein
MNPMMVAMSPPMSSPINPQTSPPGGSSWGDFGMPLEPQQPAAPPKADREFLLIFIIFKIIYVAFASLSPFSNPNALKPQPKPTTSSVPIQNTAPLSNGTSLGAQQSDVNAFIQILHGLILFRIPLECFQVQRSLLLQQLT